MTTLNAKANAAYHELIAADEREHPGTVWTGFEHERDAFEAGWEAGHEAAQPSVAPRITNEAVMAAAKAVSLDWQNFVPGMRVALEAAVPLLAPQPVVAAGDILQALTEVYESGAMGGEWPTLGTDAVMALLADAASQPVVDREALGRAIEQAASDVDLAKYFLPGTTDRFVDAVLALLNGSAK